jgi:hypothetical protein
MLLQDHSSGCCVGRRKRVHLRTSRQQTLTRCFCQIIKMKQLTQIGRGQSRPPLGSPGGGGRGLRGFGRRVPRSSPPPAAAPTLDGNGISTLRNLELRWMKTLPAYTRAGAIWHRTASSASLPGLCIQRGIEERSGLHANIGNSAQRLRRRRTLRSCQSRVARLPNAPIPQAHDLVEDKVTPPRQRNSCAYLR